MRSALASTIFRESRQSRSVTHTWPSGPIAARFVKLASTISPSPAPRTWVTGSSGITVVRPGCWTSTRYARPQTASAAEGAGQAKTPSIRPDPPGFEHADPRAAPGRGEPGDQRGAPAGTDRLAPPELAAVAPEYA